MYKLITDNIETIKQLCEKHNVATLHAFGSVCTSTFNDSSDVDLLVSFKPMDYGEYAESYFELAESFENILARPVDLVTDKSLSNPYFIQSLNNTKILLYAA